MNDEKHDNLHDGVGEQSTTAEASTQDVGSEYGTQIQEETTSKPKRSRKKISIIVAVTLVVLVLAGSGFFVWHEQPSFCNAICHEPMDEYVESYYSEDENLLVTAHSEAGVTCLECHEAKIGDQVGMGLSWITGDYSMPLDEIHYEESLCLNDRCHNMTKNELSKVFAGLDRNPHRSPHGDLACDNCHYSHTQSVMLCTQCHDDAYVPEGWLTAQEAAKEGIGDYLNVQPEVASR